MPSSRHRLLVAALLTAVAAPAQTLIVGPGNLPEIRDAISQATPGAVVVVLPGTYAHFVADRAITIHAAIAGTVHVAYDPAFAAPGCPGFGCSDDATAVRCPAGETVHLIGLAFDDNVYATGHGTARHRVIVDQGHADFDGCTIRSQASHALSVTTPQASASLQDCEVSGTGPSSTAMWVGAAQVAAVRSSFVGSPVLGNNRVGEGIQLSLGTLHGSDLDVRSGATASHGERALTATQGRCVLVDSTLTANSCPVAANAQCRFDRCTLVGGSGCAALPTAPLLGVTRPAPITPGSTFSLQFRTEPNGIVGVFAGPTLAISHPNALAGPLWLDSTGAFGAALSVADAQGVASVGWPIPVGAGIPYLTLWFVGVSGVDLPLAPSPPVGGVAR